MATKKFIIEVEEGCAKCKDCPFNEYRCSKLGYIDAEMDCLKYNLATMQIKELEEEKMKARVKAIGEIIELSDLEYDVYGNDYLRTELEITDEPDYWEKLKHQYAGMFTKSFLDNCDTSVDPAQIIDDAINMATSLVIKLKLKEESQCEK